MKVILIKKISLILMLTMGIILLAAYSGHSENNIIGTDAGSGLTTGDNNIFIGYGAGFQTTTGTNNVYLGYMAGYPDTSEDYQFKAQHYRYPAYGIFGDFSTGAFNVGSGTFRFNLNLLVSPRDTTLTAAMSGRIITNTGATAGDSLFLPTCALGLNFTFISTDADSMIIKCATGDSIFDTTVTKPSIEGHAINQALTIVGIPTAGSQYNWLVKSKNGTWAGN